MSIHTMGFVTVMAIITTIAAVVLSYIFIIPEKKRPKLGKLFQLVSDVFNFKFLIVEKILQFFYVLATLACICFGVCMLFGFSIYQSSYSSYSYTEWYGLYGMLLAIVGPIVVRLIFEASMMFVLLVKNVIQINKKLKGDETDVYAIPDFKNLVGKEEPTQPEVSQYQDVNQ